MGKPPATKASIGGVPGDGIVGRLTVIGTISRELRDRYANLVEPWRHLRGIADILRRHEMSDDITAVSIRRRMQLAPTPKGFGTMLLLRPLASAVDLWPYVSEADALVAELAHEGIRHPILGAICKVISSRAGLLQRSAAELA